MQKHTELTRQRIQGFVARIPALFYRERVPISLAVYPAPERIPYMEAIQGSYRPTEMGEKFGPLWSTHWFRVNIVIPKEWQGNEVHLRWDSCSEACIWQDGIPVQGLGGSYNGWQVEPVRTDFRLTRQAAGCESIQLYIEMACNSLFGLDNQGHNQHIGELRLAEIAIFDRPAWDLYWDLKVVVDMAVHLPANSPRAGQALYAANEMVNAIRLEDRSTWATARDIARRFLSVRNGEGQHNLSAVGHAHIDTAWLWPLAETKRKCVRTFSTAIRYMEDYPDYKFACSQAQQLAWIKEEHPALYQRIREKVEQGQFVPAGGTWVEPDCNIPSGESLVRQFLYGQWFFETEFGKRCQEFWNPDVFGYSGALPQIMKQAGIRYFLTQKLSWNQFNKPACHTFLWEGIDGSRILTHFPPADTYNSTASIREMLYNLDNFKDHERARESYMLFGYGDGGGGPTLEMLEQLGRAENVDGLPRVQVRSPREFFERCEADLKDPLVIVGELYFELHRGTYTTQARNKKFNRRSELLLRDAESLSALALVTCDHPYPATSLDALWKMVLTNQFHDIIPGSSIGEVYQDSTRDYEHILFEADKLRAEALDALCPASSHTGQLAVFNTLSFARKELVEIPVDYPGAQTASNGKKLLAVSAPSMGLRVQSPHIPEEQATISETVDGFVLENRYLKASLDPEGRLTSLYDKQAGRECIEAGHAGRFVLYEDIPVNFDAWDVDVYHLEKELSLDGIRSATVIEPGPMRVAVDFDISISANSRIRQMVSLDAISSRLEFTCEADWHERQKILKVEFPLNIRAPFATYEIQFGHVQRPTHFNTSYDLARFEVPAQRWADLSEPDYGVALLNDCKYGYAAHGNLLRLSLLRAPIRPDPEADQGRHQFRFAIFPHAGSPQMGGVIEEAYCFNVPLMVMPCSGPELERSFFSLDNPALLIDTVKKAKDGNALIVRLYEARGTRGHAWLSSSLTIRSAKVVNLLEDEIVQLIWENGVELDFKPFEIVTLWLESA